MSTTPAHLPVDESLPSLRAKLGISRSVILSAPPGAGKTTRVPLALLGEQWLAGRKILMLEPRRLAARRAAEHMARLIGETIGQTIGYRIRGDAVVSGRTRVEVVTEGILTRMLHADAELAGVGLIIFDEFHERSIHADLGLAFTIDVQQHLREDLRVLVMSATMDGVAVGQILGGAPIIESTGKAFPVETTYARFRSDKPLEVRTAEGVLRALDAEEGDILIFLPGMREMRRVEQLLHGQLPEDAIMHMLHGDLSSAIQDAALAPAPAGFRKIILSTSIAETSLTIDGVRIVVDSGLARTVRFDPRRGMSGLVTVPVSRAIADQRRGRAGRQMPGVCYRLWTEKEHEELPAYPVPEIRSSDLTHVAMDLAKWGNPDGAGLAFLDPPPAGLLAQAQRILKDLGALKDDGRLSEHGHALAMLPVHPRLAHMIVEGKKMHAGGAACELAAFLEERDVPGGGPNRDADVESRLEEFRSRRTMPAALRERILSQRSRLMKIGGINGREDKEVVGTGILLALAYPERIAKRRSEHKGQYQLAGGTTASVPPGSPLHRHEFLAVADVDTGIGEARIHLAAPLTGLEIEHTFKNKITTERHVGWDAEHSRVDARRIRRLGAVILSEQTIEPAGEEAISAFLEGVRQAGVSRLPWTKESDRLRTRFEWARKNLPELSHLPDVSDQALMSTLEEWLAPFVDGMWKLDQLERLDLLEILHARCTARDRRDLDRLVPLHIAVPSGSRVALDYSATEHPGLAVKLQELFGLTETPRIGNGKIPITIQLLSPAGRPLAVTQDLRSFWQKTYPEIRKQLRARYPKHPWPEDPFTATPTRKTIRKR